MIEMFQYKLGNFAVNLLSKKESTILSAVSFYVEES